jgi:PKD repeat protein
MGSQLGRAVGRRSTKCAGARGHGARDARRTAARSTRTAPLVATVAALVVGSLLGAADAGALVTHLRNGKTLSFMAMRGGNDSMRFDGFFSNLDYNGGPVMPATTNYAVYWAPPGAPPYPSGYQTGVNTFLEDLAHDSGGHENTDSVAAQYNDAAGDFAAYDAHFGGALVDTHPYPANGCTRATICLTDAQLQAELTRFVKEQGLPTDLEHIYMLLTPPKVEDCFDAFAFQCSAGVSGGFAAYCAYHSNARQADGSQLIYTNDPFVGTGAAAAGCTDGNFPNGISDSALEGGLSHEHNEAITDPEPNNAWTDFGGGGGESADKCRVFEPEEEFGEPLGEEEVAPGEFVKWNQEINGHRYWIQQEWSNKGHTCLQRLTLKESELPTAKFTAKAEPGNKLKVDATGSTSTAGTRYNWQFNDEEPFEPEGGTYLPSEPFETTAKTAEHEYLRPCRYLVALTVFKSDGASIGTAKTVTVGKLVKPEPTIEVFTEEPKAGAPVEFFGEPEEDEGGYITNFKWSFGDGSPSVDSFAPEHTYSAPGTYEVSLTATDICGESGTTHESVTIGPSEAEEKAAKEKAEREAKEKAEKEAAEKALKEKEAKEAAEKAQHEREAKEAAERAAREQAEREARGLTTPPPGPSMTQPAPTGVVKALGAITARSNGKGALRLRCTGTAPTCSGEGALTVKSHGRTRTIATFRFSLGTARPASVSLRLSSVGRALLKAGHGHLRATLTLRRSLPAPASRTAAAVTINLAHH